MWRAIDPVRAIRMRHAGRGGRGSSQQGGGQPRYVLYLCIVAALATAYVFLRRESTTELSNNEVHPPRYCLREIGSLTMQDLAG